MAKNSNCNGSQRDIKHDPYVVFSVAGEGENGIQEKVYLSLHNLNDGDETLNNKMFEAAQKVIERIIDGGTLKSLIACYKCDCGTNKVLFESQPTGKAVLDLILSDIPNATRQDVIESFASLTVDDVIDELNNPFRGNSFVVILRPRVAHLN